MDELIDLEKILEEHKKWLDSEGEDGRRIVFSEIFPEHKSWVDSNGEKGKRANLIKADMKKAMLSKADFTGVDLAGADFSGANLMDATFNNSDLSFVKFCNSILLGADLRCASLLATNFSDALVTEIRYDNVSKYRGIRVDSCYGSPLFKRFAQDQDFLEEFESKHKYWHSVWSLFADCGQSFGRWAGWSVGFAMLFACAFYGLGEGAFCLGNGAEGILWGPLATIYYSVVTFTTLGFGDITPKSTGAVWLVMAEVILGYVMLGGLISIFANKIARRS